MGGGVSNPGGGGSVLTVAETQVFSGTSPATWTDLDLSAIVGANVALVVLKVAGATLLNGAAVRKNGDTDEFFGTTANSTACGAALIWGITSTMHFVMLALTDSNGILEWRTGAAKTTTLDVMGYIK